MSDENERRSRLEEERFNFIHQFKSLPQAQKIEYVKKTWGVTIYDSIQLNLSNDKKYLFNCKLYSGLFD
jgi:hypothetical protein